MLRRLLSLHITFQLFYSICHELFITNWTLFIYIHTLKHNKFYQNCQGQNPNPPPVPGPGPSPSPSPSPGPSALAAFWGTSLGKAVLIGIPLLVVVIVAIVLLVKRRT